LSKAPTADITDLVSKVQDQSLKDQPMLFNVLTLLFQSKLGGLQIFYEFIAFGIPQV
jgi:hypothetical protein